MAERELKVGRKKYRAGTSDDAGRLCVSKRSPDGIGGASYRWYVSVAKTAPGPILVPDPTDPAQEVPARDGASGGLLFDLDAVEEWNRSRRGQGGYTRAGFTAETVRHTDLREQLLHVARDGKLRIVPDTGRTEVDGVLAERRQAQAVTEMRGWGLLSEPAARLGRVSITAAGRAALTRWGRA